MKNKSEFAQIEKALLAAQDICHMHKHWNQSMQCLDAILLLQKMREEDELTFEEAMAMKIASELAPEITNGGEDE